MRPRDLAKLALALFLGAVLAFPAGMMVARLGDSPAAQTAGNAGEAARVRDVYSPALRSDPWFVERQREGIEALEEHCRRTGEDCAQAREARRWLDERKP